MPGRPGIPLRLLVAVCAVAPIPFAASAVATSTTAGAAASAQVPAPVTGPAVSERPRELLVRPRGGTLQKIRLAKGLSPTAVARKLRARPDLFASAGANLVAKAAGTRVDATGAALPAGTGAASDTGGTVAEPSIVGGVTATDGLLGWIPNDHVGSVSWTSLQWNFVGQWGVGASEAWDQLRVSGSGHSGGRGVTVGVVDSGLAYRSQGGFVRSPDLPPSRVLRGYDFVDGDRFPDDQSGHGTHVASTIAAATNNDAGLTGLAYQAKLLPIRVLDERDEGDVLSIARGIRYAVERKVDIINLSVDFPVTTTIADIPEVMAAIDAARRADILVVSSSGNDGAGQVALPARSSSVLSVGATTARGCRSTFSNGGSALDLVAPGGGSDHRTVNEARCRPGEAGPPIAQVTLLRAGDPSELGVPLDYVGTSMAAAHVTAIAALVRASGILGTDPSSDLLSAYLVRSTRDLGKPGQDERYGAGLLSAEAATDRKTGTRAARSARAAVLRARQGTGSALPTR